MENSERTNMTSFCEWRKLITFSFSPTKIDPRKKIKAANFIHLDLLWKRLLNFYVCNFSLDLMIMGKKIPSYYLDVQKVLLNNVNSLCRNVLTFITLSLILFVYNKSIVKQWDFPWPGLRTTKKKKKKTVDLISSSKKIT